MTLTFLQLSQFVADAKRLGLSDVDMQAIEQLLLDKPDRGPTVARTGGVRKLRFAPPSWHTGKSGAARVLYAYFAQAGHVYFFLAYGKDEQGNLTADEESFCRALMARIKAKL